MEPVHLTEAEIKGYLEHGLEPAAIVRVHDHLRTCHVCADSLIALRALPGRGEFVPWLTGETPAGSHVDEEDLVLLVDDRLSVADRTRVEAHLRECSACYDAVEDLRSFRRELAAQNEPGRVVAMPSKPRRRAVPVWAMAAAAAAVLAGVVTVPRLVNQPRQPGLAAPVYLASIKDAPGLLGITPSGDLAGIAAAGDDRLALEMALRSGTLPHGPGAFMPARVGVLRSGAGEAARFELLYPASDRVLSDRPEFRWSAMPGATAYEVKVYDEKFDEAAQSGRIGVTQWQPQRPLARGKSYLWQVTAIRGGERVTEPAPPRPEARFLVLDQTVADRIDQARSAKTPSHLLLAVLYAGEGLRKETLLELEELDRLNPGSPLVGTLRKSLDSPAVK